MATWLSMSTQWDGAGHLPGCRLITFREIREQAGMEPPAPADDDWYDQGGIEHCEPGCPEGARRVARAMKRAEEEGIIRDGKFVWEETETGS